MANPKPVPCFSPTHDQRDDKTLAAIDPSDPALKLEHVSPVGATYTGEVAPPFSCSRCAFVDDREIAAAELADQAARDAATQKAAAGVAMTVDEWKLAISANEKK